MRHLSTARDDWRSAGGLATAGKVALRAIQHARYLRERGKPWSFEYGDRTLPAFFHPYNRTWLGERAVEVAIAHDFLARQHEGASGLEVGNVLANYGSINHRVVDKYEVGPGVENIDVVDIEAADLDFVIALSTLEHVGWDETVRDPAKLGLAIETLLGTLRPGGQMLLTLPLGYNPAVDVLVVQGTLVSDRQVIYRRDRRDHWSPRSLAELASEDFRYEHHLHSAHAVWVGELSR